MSLWLDLAGCEYRIAYVNAGGLRTRYLEAGREGRENSKEALIFLHGSGGYLEAYTKNIPAHAKHMRVFAIDMIGHGWTDKPDHPYEPKHYVKHLLDFCNAMGLERVHLSGESLGGWVATHFASTHPGRTGKIILNTAAGVHYDPAVSARIHEMSIKAAENPSRENIKKRLEWLMLDPSIVTEEMVDLRYKVYTMPNFGKVMRNVMCLHTAEFRVPNLISEEECARITAPTLVIWTSHDPGSTIEVGKKLAGMIRGSKFVVMDKCGHWPQFEDPDNFNRLQLEFLGAV